MLFSWSIFVTVPLFLFSPCNLCIECGTTGNSPRHMQPFLNVPVGIDTSSEL